MHDTAQIQSSSFLTTVTLNDHKTANIYLINGKVSLDQICGALFSDVEFPKGSFEEHCNPYVWYNPHTINGAFDSTSKGNDFNKRITALVKALHTTSMAKDLNQQQFAKELLKAA